ncbi:MAG: alpha/beta hydrolase [Acidobacteria bacterium]|nr:alpha/beta hydrolase [Acidobacteriota bacterium]
MRTTSSRTTKVLLGEIDLHYLEGGTGVHLVLVHGALSDYRAWAFQVRVLARRHHVVSYSRRYHFPNRWQRMPPDYSLEAHSRDLLSLMDHLEMGRAHLVGSSFGACICLHLACECPERVVSLALAEPPLFSWLEEDAEGREHVEKFLREVWIPARERFQCGEAEAAVRVFADGVLGKGTFEELPKAVKSSMLENTAALEAELFGRSLIEELPRDRVDGLNTPAMVLVGQNSPPLFHRSAQLLASILPCEFGLVAGATHSLHSDNPAVFNEKLLKFLARVEG